jgi:hypothetical protein
MPIKADTKIQNKPLTQRICKCCADVKPIDQFYKTTAGGRRHYCIPCETIRRREYFKKYHEKNYTKKPRKVGRPRKKTPE